MDPIRDLELPFRFYALDNRLHINLNHLADEIARPGIRVLVLIHFFGHVDPEYLAAVAMARERGVFVMEDEAHAMFTDLVQGRSGRAGDAAIWSLHKMLPVAEGGALVLGGDFEASFGRADATRLDLPSPWDFDLKAMADRRCQNMDLLLRLLKPLAGAADPLWEGDLDTGDVPQTLPVLLRGASRDRVYEDLNDAGFGVVTLYHTLVDEIEPSSFPASHAVSREILNLPVHHEAEPETLRAMVVELARCLGQ